MRKILVGIIAIISIVGVICFGADIMRARAVSNSIDKDRLQEIKEKGVITVASPLNDTPFFYMNTETNKVTGIDADIIAEIAKRFKINKVNVEATKFENLLEKLITDDNTDIAAGGIYITPEREKLVSFTQPLYKESEAVVVPKTSKINFMSDLKTSTVGVEKGTEFMNLAQKWKGNNLVKDVVIYDSISELLKAIDSGKADAGIADSILVKYFAKKDSKLSLRALKDYTPEISGAIGIAVRKNDTTLLEALNEKIDEMKADGTLYAILIENGLDKSNTI